MPIGRGGTKLLVRQRSSGGATMPRGRRQRSLGQDLRRCIYCLGVVSRCVDIRVSLVGSLWDTLSAPNVRDKKKDTYSTAVGRQRTQ